MTKARSRSDATISTRVVALAAGTAIAASLGACDTFSTFQRVGISPEGNEVRVHYPACEYESIAAVRLIDPHDPADDDDDEVIWEIASDNGSHGKGSFLVGQTPEGFVEITPLPRPIGAEDRLIAFVEMEDGVGASVEFGLPDLEPNKVLVNGEPNVNVTPEEFESRALASCRGPTS